MRKLVVLFFIIVAAVVQAQDEPQEAPKDKPAQHVGTVVLACRIGKDGIPQECQVVRGLSEKLNKKAIDQTMVRRFRPATKNGEPAEVRATIEVNFRLLEK